MRLARYDISHQLSKAVDKYKNAVLEATGLVPKLDKRDSPYLSEDTKYCVARAPCSNESSCLCPSCFERIPASMADKPYEEGGCRLAPGVEPKFRELIGRYRVVHDGETDTVKVVPDVVQGKGDNQSDADTCVPDDADDIAISDCESEDDVSFGAPPRRNISYDEVEGKL